MKKTKPVKKEQRKPRKKTQSKQSQSIKKVYLKTKPTCKVTFRLPEAAVGSAKSVCVVGDFNNWSIHEHPMKKGRNGDYAITLELEKGREYHFRYLIDETVWENDWCADKYVRSPYGDAENSVVIL